MTKIFWITYFIFYLIGSIPSLIKVRIIKSKEYLKGEDFAYKKLSKMAKDLLRISKTRVEIKGLENIPGEPCLFVLNHQGIFDGFLVLAFLERKISIIAKKEILKIPLISSWFKEINTIFIDRKNLKESVKSIYKGMELIQKGYYIVIFPEGTRSKGNFMNKFKRGSLKLALNTNVPVVPITISGSYRVLEVGNKVRGNTIKMIIHKAEYTNELTKGGKDIFTEKIFNIINDELTSLS